MFLGAARISIAKLLLASAIVAAPLGAHAAATKPAPAAPLCTPTTADPSALLDNAVTVSPTPDSRDTPPDSQISFLGVPTSELSDVAVVGSATGNHAGTLEPYSGGDGGSFVPTKPFRGGEEVTVTATLTIAAVTTPLSFNFWVADEDNPAVDAPTAPIKGGPLDEHVYVSRPDLRPTTVAVNHNSSAVAPGDIFITPTGPGQDGPEILAPNGAMIFFQPLPHGTTAADFQAQQYMGQPVLTWWQGRILLGHGAGEDVMYSDSYKKIATIRAGNGVYADLHELVISPQNTAYLTSFNPIRCNLQANGGPRDDGITDALFQEIDIPTGLVMYQWTSIAHVPVSASYIKIKGSSLKAPYDWFHLNSIDLDPDGSLLISSRNTWAIDDLNAQTGQINWTLGGKDATITGAAGVGTAWQHDARALGDGLYSIFDNGASPKVHQQSRGIVVSINTTTNSATLVSQFFHSPSLSAVAEGDLQQLSNDDWFIGWGEQGFFSELNAAGTQIFTAHLPWDYTSYRSFKFVWSGQPTTPPAIGLARVHTGAWDVYASWNGATTVASYELLAGTSSKFLVVHATVPSTSFETKLTLPADTGDRYVAVRALDANGDTLATSATVALK
jgi:hypothetical protein